MSRNLQQKQDETQVLAGLFAESGTVFVVGYAGCKCSELTTLRRKLGPIGSKFAVVKNTLAKRAVAGTGAIGLDPYFKGPTGVVWAGKDPVGSAKVLSEFAKISENFKLKAGVFEGNTIAPQDIESLANTNK